MSRIVLIESDFVMIGFGIAVFAAVQGGSIVDWSCERLNPFANIGRERTRQKVWILHAGGLGLESVPRALITRGGREVIDQGKLLD